MKKIISLAAILISLTIIFTGTLIALIIDSQSAFSSPEFIMNVSTILMLLSFFGIVISMGLLIKQSSSPE